MLDEHNPDGEVSVERRSDRLMIHAFGRLDRTAFGSAVGLLCGVLISSATVIVLLNGGGGESVPLQLLAQYYPGYTVSIGGALLGFLYASLTGFLLGWLLAAVRNASLQLYLWILCRRAELSKLDDFLDRV